MRQSGLISLNHWHLGIILGSALGLPAIIIGGKVSTAYGVGPAITSVFIGNLILWAIGMGVVSMGKSHHHIVHNVRLYLGKWSSIIASILIVVAFLSWFAIQNQGVDQALTYFFTDANGWKKVYNVRIGVTLGVICSFLSIWHIKLIKPLCMVGFPLLVLYAIYMMIFYPLKGEINWGISFPGILLIGSSWLPGIINISTFFRHSPIKESSILGLSLMTLFHMFFQFFAIFCSLDTLTAIFKKTSSHIEIVLTIGFIVLAFFCINLVNIYFGSVGWKRLLPGSRSFLDYITIGLLGTILYIYFPLFPSVTLIEVAVGGFFANLGTILLLRFLVSDIIKSKERSKDNLMAALCWLIGCVVTVMTVIFFQKTSYPLIFGVCATFLFFLILIFIKETIHSVKDLKKSRLEGI